jgi:hypothetical protein
VNQLNAFEDTQSRKSIVSDTLQSLAEQARQWREKIDLLEAGQQVDRTEAIADLGKLLDVCQNLRDAILSEDSAAVWHTKDELHSVVSKLDDAAVKRQRYLDLAQFLAAGTVSHRREKTRQERLRLRDAAVAELMEISAQTAPPDLPGPAVPEWLSWACNLDDSTDDPDLKNLNANFPRVDDFVRQLEIELWHDGSVVSSGRLSNEDSAGTKESDGSSSGMRIEEATPEKETPSAYADASAAQEQEESGTICATEEAPVATQVEDTEATSTPRAASTDKLSFFAEDEVDTMMLYLGKAKKEGKSARKVRALMAVSNWLTPPDQNPVLQPRCGIRVQLGYTGKSDLAPVTPDEAAKAIEQEEGLLLFTGGADLLRWSLGRSTGGRFDAVASIRRLSEDQLRSWFSKLYKIELAEPQVQDVYRLTRGIPLLVGEMHRRTIPVPEAPPTWLGFAIWTQIKQNYEAHLPALARELRDGPPAVRLTEREISVLKMVVIASDTSTPETIASNLMENWRKFHHPEHEALTSADEVSIRVLLKLGLLPMRSESGLRAIKAILPVDADDPIRQIVSYL